MLVLGFLAATNFEQVEQSGNRMEFRGLSQVKNCRGNFPGPIKRLNKYDLSTVTVLRPLNGQIASAGETRRKIRAIVAGKMFVYRCHSYLRRLLARVEGHRKTQEQSGIGAACFALAETSSIVFPSKFMRASHTTGPVATAPLLL